MQQRPSLKEMCDVSMVQRFGICMVWSAEHGKVAIFWSAKHRFASSVHESNQAEGVPKVRSVIKRKVHSDPSFAFSLKTCNVDTKTAANGILFFVAHIIFAVH